jgi:metal-dependent amidase/aminoacylase/carboxypeptidase family protein
LYFLFTHIVLILLSLNNPYENKPYFITMRVFATGRGAKKYFTYPGNTKADALKDQVITWRRDFHEHPELGNHEVRTSAIIAKHLQSLGIEVQTGIATTGVVGILKGGNPGPVVALRADMDGLPVIERTPVPFASKVKTTYNGQEVGVMHACGHDSHMAILMGVAQVLIVNEGHLHGTVKFIFQPAEEGVEPGQKGGAEANGEGRCAGKPESRCDIWFAY